MPFDISDFNLTGDTPSSPPLEQVIRTILSSVAFCVYDSRKTEEIFDRIRHDLEDQFGINLVTGIQWNPPTVHCQVTAERS